MTKFFKDQNGIAMTETALLCFFLYVPVLMMVIIWGDMTLDKTRAHVAGAYLAFSGREQDSDDIRDVFFPGATGTPQGHGAVRSANIERMDLSEGPTYELPHPRSGDYSGDQPPDYDLQYRLYSIAQGRFWLTTSFDGSGGGAGFEQTIHQSLNDMARYLRREDIVDAVELPEDGLVVQPGENVSIDTGVDSRAYTQYADMLTEMYNTGLSPGGDPPRAETTTILRTSFRSPFFRELERGYDRTRWRGGTIGGGLPQSFDMYFGPQDEMSPGSQWASDDSFHTGYAYLRVPEARPDGDSLLDILASIELRSFHNMFVVRDNPDINIADLPLAVSESEFALVDGEYEHDIFLTPGDPR